MLLAAIVAPAVARSTPTATSIVSHDGREDTHQCVRIGRDDDPFERSNMLVVDHSNLERHTSLTSGSAPPVSWVMNELFVVILGPAVPKLIAIFEVAR